MITQTTGRARFLDGPLTEHSPEALALVKAGMPPALGGAGWGVVSVLEDSATEFRLEKTAGGELQLQKRDRAARTGDGINRVPTPTEINAKHRAFWARPAGK